MNTSGSYSSTSSSSTETGSSGNSNTNGSGSGVCISSPLSIGVTGGDRTFDVTLDTTYSR